MGRPLTRGLRLAIISILVFIAMLVSGPTVNWIDKVLSLGSVPSGPAFWLVEPNEAQRGIHAGQTIAISVSGGGGTQRRFHWTATGSPVLQSFGTVELNARGEASFAVVPSRVTSAQVLWIHLSGIPQPLVIRVIP